MPLLGPNDADRAKIHSEITQIVHQRILITTLSVTVWGFAVAWLLPKDVPTSVEPLGMFRYLASSLLNSVLFALFLLNHNLTQMLRVFTTYLEETGESNWERDWTHYRGNFRYLGYTKSQSLVFIVLGSISTTLPFLLMLAYPFTYTPLTGLIICLGVGLLYVIMVTGMGMKSWFAREDRMRQHWRELRRISSEEK